MKPTRYLVIVPNPKGTELLDPRVKPGSYVLRGTLDSQEYVFVFAVDETWMNEFFEGKDALRMRSLIFELQ